MSKRRESAAERIWKEKLDERGSWSEAAAALAIVAALAAVLLLAGA